MRNSPGVSAFGPATSPGLAIDTHWQARMHIGVGIAGFCTFLPLYATQPLLPDLQRLFSASALATSMTISAVTIAIAIASPLVGSVADSIGRKRIIVAAILGLSIPTWMAATSATLSQLIAWRFAQGMFIPGIIAVTLAYIAEEAPTGTNASITATYVTGTVLGGMCGRFFMAVVANYSSWRTAFLFLGLMTAVCGLLTWIGLPRSRRFVRQHDFLAPLRSMTIHLRNRRLLATYFVGFNSLFTMVGIFTYVNFYLAGEPFSLGLVALGSVFFVYGLGLIITPLAGPLIDRYGCRAALVAAAGGVVAGALITLVPLVWCVIAGLAVLSSGIFVAQSAASSHIGMAASEARSSAAGLYVCFYYLGGTVGATILGWLWKCNGWPACVACVVVMQAISASVALRFFNPSVHVPASHILG
jgi:MFS transporter, YNFM family, putative membrane transport protein